MNKGKLTIRGALVWSFAERYTSLVVAIASTMILARLLTPAQVGVFSLCAAFTAVAGILRDFGISEYLIQEKNLTKDKIRAALMLAIIIAWSVACLILVSRHTISDYYSEPGVAEVLGVIALNFLLLPFASPAFALLNREMDFRKVYAVQTISTVCNAISSVFLAYNGYGFMSLAWGNFIGIVCQNIILVIIRPRDSLILPGLKEARSVLAYGTVFVSSRVIETLSRNVHEYIIAAQMGFTSVGLFSRAMGLIELLYTNFTSAILRVTTPVFANDHRQSGNLAERFATGTAMLTVVAWPFYGFIIFMAEDVIRVLFGTQWTQAAPIASVLALSIMPNYLTVLGPSLLAATGHVKVRLKITLWYAPVHIMVMFGASKFGIIAIAAAFSVSNIFALLLYIYNLVKIIGCNASQLFKGSGKSVLVGILCLAFQFIGKVICNKFEVSALLSLLFVSTVTVFVWFLSIQIVRHPIRCEIERYFSWCFGFFKK